MQDHSLSLRLSLFSHNPTPPSPTWTQNAHSTLSPADLLQEILSKWVCKSYKTELSVPLKLVQELLNTVKAQPVNWDTHTLKQSRFDSPEDKACAACFCQCSVQRGRKVPITTFILEAAYDFGPNPSSGSEQIPIPLCLERQGVRKSSRCCAKYYSKRMDYCSFNHEPFWKLRSRWLKACLVSQQY